eukprot:2106228-Pyramimonas_sp.AAC.1
MMMLFTLGAYEQVHTLWPSLSLTQVVDDGSLQATGTHDQVLKVLIPAARRLWKELVDLGLELSPNKGHAIATSTELEKQIETALKQH